MLFEHGMAECQRIKHGFISNNFFKMPLQLFWKDQLSMPDKQDIMPIPKQMEQHRTPVTHHLEPTAGAMVSVLIWNTPVLIVAPLLLVIKLQPHCVI